MTPRLPSPHPPPLHAGRGRRRRAFACARRRCARACRAGPDPVLSGTEFQLEIGPVPINVTGRPRTATGVNGQMPAPILRWREGDTVTLAVTNRLSEPSSIHWHGVRTPAPMDGVPGLSFARHRARRNLRLPLPGASERHLLVPQPLRCSRSRPGSTAPIVIEPKGGYAQAFDRDYVVMLSDWTDENPDTIVSNLKFQSDYYNYGQRTLGTFVEDAQRTGPRRDGRRPPRVGQDAHEPDRHPRCQRAPPTPISLNGQPPAANWTALFQPGERVRLRFINGSSMSIFDVRIPGLPMTVVQADGNDVAPVTVDEFRISVAETYDVIVQPPADRAYTIFAQAEDRTGYARGTLAPRAGMAAAIPPMDPAPAAHHGRYGHGAACEHGAMPGMDHAMPGMDHGSMAGMTGMETSPEASKLQGSVGVDNVAMMPTERLHERRRRLSAGRRVLTYADLRATQARQRSAAALARHHAASDRQHGALHLGLRRQEVFRSRADRAPARRARALRADQRHDDGAPDPSARPVERARKRPRRIPPLQAHDQRQAGRAAELSRHRRRRPAAGPITAISSITWRRACSARCASS